MNAAKSIIGDSGNVDFSLIVCFTSFLSIFTVFDSKESGKMQQMSQSSISKQAIKSAKVNFLLLVLVGV